MRTVSFWLVMLLVALCPYSAQAGEYRVGLLMPLSGSKSNKGIPMKNAVELFVERFNAAGGLRGNKIRLVVKDDFDEPDRARAAAKELVQDPQLLAVIGHYYSATALGAVQVYDQAQIPCLSPNVSAPEVISASRYMFTTNFQDDVQGGFMAVYLKEVMKKDNVFVVYTADPFGRGLQEAFVKKAAAIGLNVVGVQPVDNSAVPADWAAKNLPDAAERDKIGAVAALMHSESGLAVLPQLRDSGVKAVVLAPNTWTNAAFLSLDEKYTSEVYVTSALLWEIANERATAFSEEYRRRFGQPPPAAAALAYDSILLIAQGLKALDEPQKGHVPTREGLRDYLAHLSWQEAIDGASGSLFFSSSGDVTQGYVDKFLAERAGESPAPAAAPQERAPAKAAEGRAVQRDVFVSVIKDGRYKTAYTQLVVPKEEYVLKELKERVQKGYMMVVDRRPYHLVDVVFVGVDIFKINDVNTKDMTWDADMFMWFKWNGDRLEPKDIDKIGVINSVKEQSSLLKEDLSRPTKYRAFRKRFTLSTSYDLAKFPFDYQSLTMSVAHTSKNSTHLMLVMDAKHMDDTPIDKINPQEWTFLGRKFYSNLYQYTSTFGDPDYRLGKGYKSRIYFSTVNVEVNIKRIIQPYLFTFFLPLIIILGIILLVLWVPLEHFAPRFSASISGLVGILLYHMSQKNSFPKVGYAIIADYYFLIAYVFVVGLIISIIGTQTLQGQGHKERAKKLNRQLALSAITGVVLIYSAITILLGTSNTPN